MGLFLLAIFIVIEILFINGGNETWEDQNFVDSYFKLIIYQITIISCIFSNSSGLKPISWACSNVAKTVVSCDDICYKLRYKYSFSKLDLLY